MRTWGPGRDAPAQQEQADAPCDDPQMDRVVRRYFWFYAISAVPCWLLTIVVGLMLVTVFPLRSSFPGVILGMFVLMPAGVWAVVSSLAAWGMMRRRPQGYLAHWAAILCMLLPAAWGIKFRFTTPSEYVYTLRWNHLGFVLIFGAAAFGFVVFATTRALQPGFRSALLGAGRTPKLSDGVSRTETGFQWILRAFVLVCASVILYPVAFAPEKPRMETHQERIAKLDRAIEENPTDVEARLKRGNAHVSHYDPHRAGDDYLAVLAEEPDNVRALSGLALAQSGLGQRAKAIETWGKVIELSPDEVTAYESRGVLHLQFQHFDQAVADFEAALEHRSYRQDLCADAHYHWARQLREEGKKPEAIAQLQRALEVMSRRPWSNRQPAEQLLERWQNEEGPET